MILSETLTFLLLLHWIIGSEAVQCRFEVELKSYPNNYKRARDKCEGTSCVYMNMTTGLDTAKKTWVGFGYGCDPPFRPLCRPLGAVNKCITLDWQTLSVFGIATVTIKSPKDGVLCCCDGSDFCDPRNPQKPKNVIGASDVSSKPTVTGPSSVDQVGGSSPTRVLTFPPGSNQLAAGPTRPPPSCVNCCECSTVNGSQSSVKKFNIGIFLGVYICVVAAAVVISPSYMLARCLPQE